MCIVLSLPSGFFFLLLLVTIPCSRQNLHRRILHLSLTVSLFLLFIFVCINFLFRYYGTRVIYRCCNSIKWTERVKDKRYRVIFLFYHVGFCVSIFSIYILRASVWKWENVLLLCFFFLLLRSHILRPLRTHANTIFFLFLPSLN